MKKALLALLLIAALTLSFAACDFGGESTSDNNGPELSTTPLGGGGDEDGMDWNDPTETSEKTTQDEQNTQTPGGTPATGETTGDSNTETTGPSSSNQGGLGDGGADTDDRWGALHPA